jgi:hypothetical protein
MKPKTEMLMRELRKVDPLHSRRLAEIVEEHPGDDAVLQRILANDSTQGAASLPSTSRRRIRSRWVFAPVGAGATLCLVAAVGLMGGALSAP